MKPGATSILQPEEADAASRCEEPKNGTNQEEPKSRERCPGDTVIPWMQLRMKLVAV